MHSSPFFSVIVSVYNAADTLARCLNSLVYQFFDNIEIIVVEKESTDNSLEIIKLYEKEFPFKVKCCERPYSHNAAAGWNYGIHIARGTYIAFCDADDFLSLSAFEELHNCLTENPVDILHFSALGVTGANVQKRIGYTNTSTINMVCQDYMSSVWNRVFRREFMLRMGDVPDIYAPDIAYNVPAVSNAETMDFSPKRLYYHMAEGGTTKDMSKLRIHGSIDSWDFLLKCNVKAEHKDCIGVCISSRANMLIRRCWRCMDDFILWVQEHKDLFIDNELLKERPPLYNQMMKYIEGYQEWIPKTVYVNGFGNSLTDEWLEHIKGESFNFGCDTLVVLNETNCDINLNEQIRTAYKNKEYDYLGHYFAVKNIYENGGIYVGPRIRMTLSFNVLRQYPSFFAFIDENTFSDQIFGALSGNAVFRELLYTYEKSDFYDDTFCSISERIRNILVAKYSVPLNGKRFRNQDLYIVDPSQTAVDSGNGNNLCLHDFTDCINDDEYVVVKKSSLCLLGDDKNYAVLLNQKNALQKQIKDIENSDSWKLIKRLKKFAHSKIGRIPLRFFKYCVKKFRKRKYGIG